MIPINHKTPHNQSDMEQTINDYFSRIAAEGNTGLTGMLNLRLQSCDYQNRTAIFTFEPSPWMINSAGILHGGVTASLFDVALGVLCRYYSSSDICPTVHLDVNYLLPIPTNTALCVETHLLRNGNPLCTAEGFIYTLKSSHRIFASSTGLYYASSTSHL